MKSIKQFPSQNSYQAHEGTFQNTGKMLLEQGPAISNENFLPPMNGFTEVIKSSSVALTVRNTAARWENTYASDIGLKRCINTIRTLLICYIG